MFRLFRAAGALPPLALAIALALPACTPPEHRLAERRTQAGPVPHGFGRIFVYRESTVAGAATPAEIRVDGRPVGAVPDGGGLHADLRPGEHRVTLARRGTEAGVMVLVRGERTVWVRVETHLGAGGLSFSLTETPEPRRPPAVPR